VICGRTFFDLQIDFARRVSLLSGLPLSQSLLTHTNLYARFGLGRDFDGDHPVWHAFLDGALQSSDLQAWTYQFYRSRPEASVPGVISSVGCFSFGHLGDGRIRLHFQNAEQAGRSPLGIEQFEQRKSELTALFSQIQRMHTHPPRIVGASWLYNLEAYRRLFPSVYIATARTLFGRFQSMPLWGQFLDRTGEVRPEPKGEFLERLERQRDLEGLSTCFPLQVLALESSALPFYDFYAL
jgi:hypothetical protein